jgi:hypothetical protein
MGLLTVTKYKKGVLQGTSTVEVKPVQILQTLTIDISEKEVSDVGGVEVNLESKNKRKRQPNKKEVSTTSQVS